MSVALYLGAFLVALGIGSAARAEAAWLVMVHRSPSVTILTVIGLRVAWRLYTPFGPLPANAPAVPRVAARASVIVLYVLLSRAALMGLSASMLYGGRIVVFGGIEVPSFLADERVACPSDLASARLGRSAVVGADRPTRWSCAT